MKARYNDQLHRAYGIFTPGSAARDLRTENARSGLRTCGCCLRAFAPEDTVNDYYCSIPCARGDDPKFARLHPAITWHDDELTIDNRDCACAK